MLATLASVKVNSCATVGWLEFNVPFQHKYGSETKFLHNIINTLLFNLYSFIPLTINHCLGRVCFIPTYY